MLILKYKNTVLQRCYQRWKDILLYFYREFRKYERFIDPISGKSSLRGLGGTEPGFCSIGGETKIF